MKIKQALTLASRSFCCCQAAMEQMEAPGWPFFSVTEAQDMICFVLFSTSENEILVVLTLRYRAVLATPCKTQCSLEELCSWVPPISRKSFSGPVCQYLFACLGFSPSQRLWFLQMSVTATNVNQYMEGTGAIWTVKYSWNSSALETSTYSNTQKSKCKQLMIESSDCSKHARPSFPFPLPPFYMVVSFFSILLMCTIITNNITST